MTRVLLFNLLQILASGYAVARGGGPERVVGVALFVAAITTRLVGQDPTQRFGSMEVGVALVDVCLFVVLLLVALHADRWWTLWVASLHLLGMGAHVARAVDPSVERMAYAILVATWSYPMMVLLVVGTMRHRERLARTGVDVGWSPKP